MTIEASPKKLRNGSWGCLAHSAGVRAGDTVTITTRAGKSWDARVERVVWTGDGKAICATTSLDRPAASNGGGRRSDGWSECCGYPCPVTGRRCMPSDPCHDCE